MSAFCRRGGVKNWPNLPTDSSKKMPTTEGGRGQKSWKFADVLNGWSLLWNLLTKEKLSHTIGWIFVWGSICFFMHLLYQDTWEKLTSSLLYFNFNLIFLNTIVHLKVPAFFMHNKFVLASVFRVDLRSRMFVHCYKKIKWTSYILQNFFHPIKAP